MAQENSWAWMGREILEFSNCQETFNVCTVIYKLLIPSDKVLLDILVQTNDQRAVRAGLLWPRAKWNGCIRTPALTPLSQSPS